MSEGYDTTDLLALMFSERAERLKLHAGRPPVLGDRGEPKTVEGPSISSEKADSLLRSLANTRQIREFYKRGLVAFIHTSPNLAQFQVQAKLVGDEIQIDLERVAV